MTGAIKIIWLTAAIIWSPILIAKAFSAEATLPVKMTAIAASNPEELARILNEISPAASDASTLSQLELQAAPDDDQDGGVNIEETEEERILNYE